MKTYWYLVPIIGFIWFAIDTFTWNNTKIPPIEDQHIWQYLFVFYLVGVHIPAMCGLIFLLMLIL
jgi:hypothetical protein